MPSAALSKSPDLDKGTRPLEDEGPRSSSVLSFEENHAEVVRHTGNSPRVVQFVGELQRLLERLPSAIGVPAIQVEHAEIVE